MSQHIQAIFEHGVLRPLEPLGLRERDLVSVSIEKTTSGAPLVPAEKITADERQVAADLFNELGEVWEKCQRPDWDGYGAQPVTRAALQSANRLLESLQSRGVPRPSIGAEPDGQLTLEWHRSTRRTLSVSVSPDAELHYAALFGPSRTCGTEPFFGDVPDAILALIRRVYE